MTAKKKNAIKFAILVAFVVAVIVLARMFDVAALLSPEVVQAQVQSYGIWAPLVFMVAYAVITIVFLPASPFSVVAGALFGPVFGTIYIVLGATIGAFLAFLLARFLGESYVESLLKGKFKKLLEYDEKLRERGLPVVIFLRLVPLFPFNGLNFALGLTLVSWRSYLLGTFLGIIPGSFVFAYLGSSLAALSLGRVALAALLFTLLVAIVPCYRWYEKRCTDGSHELSTDKH